MANKRREGNRRRSARGENLEESGNRSSGWSGSPAHTERRGKHGEKGAQGAGELTMAGPGPMAERVSPHAPRFETAKGTPPKSMKVYREE